MNKIVLLILISIFYIPDGCAYGVLKKNNLNKPYYALMIDAGSSGSRIYIYRVQPNIYEKLPLIELIGQKKVSPGISTFEQNGDLIFSQMDSLITFAESKIDSINWSETKLYLMATAGMRLLNKKQQKNTMQELAAFLKQNSKFNFKKALIISGQYEALYAWSALNYLDDKFDPSTPKESMLEMGGASTQITFLSEKSKDKNVLYRNYRGNAYAVFAKSYLNMGQDKAQKLIGVPACFPKNYPLTHDSSKMGLGDFGECSQEIKRVFIEICDSLGIADSLFNSNFQANTENDFIAIAAFYYTFNFLEFKDTVTLDSLRYKGEIYCGKSWEEIKSKYSSADTSYLKSYCFNAAYFWTLLSQTYGFNKNTIIRTKNKINKQEISWTLGAVIDIEMGHQPKKHK